ncbi:FAD/NAD-P-binding domain-containing protein [Mycena olivaceomarginata]|nr:FAD/NAD-P-binding domain-containing protein [Mycena olivaceomarginata]
MAFLKVYLTPKPLWPTFDHPIRRVAVVGAGPAGLQAAAKLIEHNFTVRLFERAPHPGGNWLYSEETPVRSRIRDSYADALFSDNLNRFSDKPLGQTAEIPAQLPVTRYYNEGDDGLTLDDRWTEHWQPRPLWKSLHINTPQRNLTCRGLPKVSTELPDVKYDPDTPWVVSHHAVQRHVRSYASHHCLNSNDYCPATASAPPATAYSTRVEKMEKNMEAHTWVLTLRRLERLHESHRILAEWWTETFDAVVLATGPYTAPHVPDIDGIVDWSKATEGGQYSVYHSQTVLIVGASVSASEIARDIGSFAHRIIASVRPANDSMPSIRQLDLSRFPNITEFVPEIAFLEPLSGHRNGIRSGKIHLINGSVLQGIDEAIPCFLPIQRRSGPEDIHWTGHYIPDPTLAYTFGRPWTLGRYQSYGLAKVWEGIARLPTSEQMKLEEEYWREWLGEEVFRRYITWLNNASLEHGGRFVEPPPIENLEILKYYMFVYLLNNTMNLDSIGNFDISMLSGQLGGQRCMGRIGDEDDDW